MSVAHLWLWDFQFVTSDVFIVPGSLAEVLSTLMNSIFHKVHCGDWGIRVHGGY